MPRGRFDGCREVDLTNLRINNKVLGHPLGLQGLRALKNLNIEVRWGYPGSTLLVVPWSVHPGYRTSCRTHHDEHARYSLDMYIQGRQGEPLGSRSQIPVLGPQLPVLGPHLPVLGPHLPVLGASLPVLGARVKEHFDFSTGLWLRGPNTG